MPGTRKSVLILGGTQDASELAGRLANQPNLRVITSLAGRTAHPGAIAGETRIGGFGGVNGLSRYLTGSQIDLLVDATHPFATKMSSHAAQASRQTGVALMSLVRPPWQPVKGDDWQSVPTLDAAREALPTESRVFLALGRQYISAFSARRDLHCVIRMVDPPVEILPFASMELILGRPGNLSEETDLLRSRSIDHLVCRNSGGHASYAKVEAARHLSIPVIMIDRPAMPVGQLFQSVDDLTTAIL
ncbi:MAG: cobalt-precorrin-6A reductase [Alphaproteobacteria bacterium]|nr:cobalt-precorrin-6A reductase [Alphaproteobacteria bacterium]